MCEFCAKHGDGKTWYLQAKNYSDDLMSDLRRRNYVGAFFGHPEALARDVDRLKHVDRLPGLLQRVAKWNTSRALKQVHFGQVVPMEDVERVLAMVTSVTRMACMCRHVRYGTEHRYCYAVSMAPNGGRLLDEIRRIDPSYLSGPGSAGLESLSKDEAIAAFRQHELEGLFHTVWAYVPPFSGSFCNCDRSACMATRATLQHQTPAMFRGEFVGRVERTQCNGCGACVRACPFGAIHVRASTRQATISPQRCYGCGICRAACERAAIVLDDRATTQERPTSSISRQPKTQDSKGELT